MTHYLNDGDCVVQILACEQNVRRLFDDISKHVAADRAEHAAVYEARVVIETHSTGSHARQDGPITLPTKLHSVYLGHSDLTLTLLHMDTTFRFNGASVKNSSPSLAWPTIHQSFPSNAFVDDDLILRASYHHPDARLKPDQAPGALLLHVEMFASSHADTILLEMAETFRAMRCFWSRQLLFSQDPARFRKASDGVLGVLMQEFDPQQTAETLAARINDVSLRHVRKYHPAEFSVRIFSLVGMSSQRLKVPMEPGDLPIQNRLYSTSVNDNSRTETYFGLKEDSFVQT